MACLCLIRDPEINPIRKLFDDLSLPKQNIIIIVIDRVFFKIVFLQLNHDCGNKSVVGATIHQVMKRRGSKLNTIRSGIGPRDLS